MRKFEQKAEFLAGFAVAAELKEGERIAVECGRGWIEVFRCHTEAPHLKLERKTFCAKELHSLLESQEVREIQSEVINAVENAVRGKHGD